MFVHSLGRKFASLFVKLKWDVREFLVGLIQKYRRMWALFIYSSSIILTFCIGMSCWAIFLFSIESTLLYRGVSLTHPTVKWTATVQRWICPKLIHYSSYCVIELRRRWLNFKKNRYSKGFFQLFLYFHSLTL